MNQKQKVKKIANSKVQPLILSCIVNIQGEYLLGQLLAINEFDRTAMVRHNNSAIWYNID